MYRIAVLAKTLDFTVSNSAPDDLRCAGCKVKSDLSPFAVVVRLIQVGSERRFVEHEVGQRFYFDFYGAKWLAFPNGPGNI